LCQRDSALLRAALAFFSAHAAAPRRCLPRWRYGWRLLRWLCQSMLLFTSSLALAGGGRSLGGMPGAAGWRWRRQSKRAGAILGDKAGAQATGGVNMALSSSEHPRNSVRGR